MNTFAAFRRLMSLMLTAAIFLSLSLPAAGSEVLEETVAVTEPAETVLPETVPAETLPAETLPPETVPPEILPTETIPEETSSVEETFPTEVLPEETIPAETAPEEAIPDQTLPEGEPVQILTVAETLQQLPGTRGITLRGVVVYAEGWQAVMQDETGGIRLSFAADPALTVGEHIQVMGCRTEGLAVEDFMTLGMAGLPSVAATLEAAPENHRIRLTGAYLENGLLSQNGAVLPIIGKTDLTGWVNVTGVLLDGVLHADSITQGTQPEMQRFDPALEAPYAPYFGLLHSHSGLDGVVMEPKQAFAIAKGLGMDFFALTNASDHLDNKECGKLSVDGSFSQAWEAGKQAAKEASNSGFLALFGFEMAWPAYMFHIGHIVTLNTSGWQYWMQPGMNALENYLSTLETAPEGVSIFAHPSDEEGNFNRFSDYEPGHDKYMHLLELGTGEDPLEYYNMALRNGWHVAPAAPEQEWEALQSGSAFRTAVLSHSLTDTGIYDAIRSYRVYATQDGDLEICYTLNDAPMGSTIGVTKELTAQLWVKDPTDSGRIEIQVWTEARDPVGIHSLSDGEGYLSFRVADGHEYYYLVIAQEDGDIAVTAPVWMDNYENMGIRHFGTDTVDPVEGMEIGIDLEVYNDEPVDFFLETVEVYEKQEEGDLLHYSATDGDNVVYAGKAMPFHFFYSRPESGEVCLYAKITGYVNGKYREYREELPLLFLETEPEILPIEEVRRGVPGQVYRIEGYVTAGNDNPYNVFDPPMVYVQDASGGIAVNGSLPTIYYKQRAVIKGKLWEDNYGNRGLELLHGEFSGEHFYPYQPKAVDCKSASDYERNGGRLVKVRGEVLSTVPTFDKKGLTRINLRDGDGGQATVLIETSIHSAAYGTNTLAAKIKQGRTVEAIGIVHIDDHGKTVVRVRNADEVSYIAPVADPTNPNTGDVFHALLHWLERLWGWLLEMIS